MKRSTHTTAASSWRACAAESSAISRALPPVTQPPQEKPTTVATMTDPAQAQNSTALLARYCSKRCDRVWFWRCSIATSPDWSASHRGKVIFAPLGRLLSYCRRRAERRVPGGLLRWMRPAPARRPCLTVLADPAIRAANLDQRCRSLFRESSDRSQLQRQRKTQMGAANRNLEEEFDALKAGLDTPRKDISSRVSSFGAATTDEIRTRGRRARAAVGRAADRAGEVWDDATNEASRRGREGAAALEQQIEE